MDKMNATQQCMLMTICTLIAHAKETTGFITQMIQRIKKLGYCKEAAIMAAGMETSVSALETALSFTSPSRNASPETPQTDLHSLRGLCLEMRSFMPFSQEQLQGFMQPKLLLEQFCSPETLAVY